MAEMRNLLPSRPRSFRRVLFPCLAAVLLAVACGGSREATVPANSVVLVIGDSITAGHGVDADQAWPARLAQRTGWRVVAAGVDGDRSAGGRERLPALLDEHAPVLVIIELGGNDLLRGVTAAEIAGNLDAMVEAVRARGARVALIAVPQPSAIGALTGLSPAGLYRELARRRGIPLVEKALPSVLSDERLRLDPVHPNAAGHQALAERAVAELEKTGLVPAR
jgi:acyl-CoA thioesterase-1